MPNREQRNKRYEGRGRGAQSIRALLFICFCAAGLFSAFRNASAEAEPTPAPTPCPTPFTLAWVPDTQASVYFQPAAMEALGDWIKENAEKENILAVLHTGDLVDNGFADWQWENFELFYHRIEGVVPFFPIAGNHDLDRKRLDWTGYLARPYVKNAVPEDQQYGGGKAAYMTFSAGGRDFIVAGIGFSAEREAAPWVRDVFNQYPNRHGILLLHDYLHPRGNQLMEFGPFTFERVVKRCKNVRLVLSGHYRGTAYREDYLDDYRDGTPNRVVRTMLCNYQGMAFGGGVVRLLRFDPGDGSITVTTFSAMTGHPLIDKAFKQSVFRLEDAF